MRGERIRADAGRALARALLARTEGVRIIGRDSEPWASVTFTGARHRISVMVPHALRRRFRHRLDADAFTIPGHVVADIAAEHVGPYGADAHHYAIEALTVED